MSKSDTQSEETLTQKETRNKLTKYTSDQLAKKLKEGTLIGLSIDVARDILKKRNDGHLLTEIDSSQEKKPKGWTKDGEVKVATKTTVVEKVTVEKTTPTTKKVSVPKEAKKKMSVEFTPDQTKVISSIVDDASLSKTKKIQKLSSEGFSVLEISKIEALSAHYSFIHSTVKKMTADESK